MTALMTFTEDNKDLRHVILSLTKSTPPHT